MPKPVALITGASSGIGLELARCCAADGYRVVLVARDPKRLEEAAQHIRDEFKVEVFALAHDLALPSAPAVLVEETRKLGLSVHTLINNAGFAIHGAFRETDLNEELEELAVNIGAVTELTKRFLPDMLKARDGRILNVASLAAFLPGPLMSVYYASKAYVLSFSLALRNELQGTGVRVTCLCPGATATNFSRRAHIAGTGLEKASRMSAAAVAAAGYRGLKKGRNIVIPGYLNSLQAFSLRFAPRGLAAAVARRLHERR